MLSIQTLLGHISPGFANVDGVPLAMLVLVLVVTATTVLFYLGKGLQVGYELRRAVSGIMTLRQGRVGRMVPKTSPNAWPTSGQSVWCTT